MSKEEFAEKLRRTHIRRFIFGQTILAALAMPLIIVLFIVPTHRIIPIMLILILCVGMAILENSKNFVRRLSDKDILSYHGIDT